MTIPNDPFGREWVEDSFNQSQRSAFDSVLVSLAAWGPDRQVALIGTGFIIAAFGRQALVVTAAHNFEHAARVQRPWSLSHPTALPEFSLSMTQTIETDPRSVRAFYRSDSVVDACIVGQVSMAPEIDIALFVMQLQESAPDDLLRNHIAIDTSEPAIGSEVAVTGYAPMAIYKAMVRGEEESLRCRGASFFVVELLLQYIHRATA
jgi:hypothetical protein